MLVNRSQAALLKSGVVPAGIAPACPACGRRLEFRTDRLGRTMEYCDCGHNVYVLRRGGEATYGGK